MPRQENRSGTSNRGFASMDPELQRAIASKGGKAAHQSGNAHRFTSEEAREAGRKGGQAAHRSSSRASRSSDEYEEGSEGKSSKGSSSAMLNAGGPRAQPGDQSGGEWPESENEGRGRGREDQFEGTNRDYQAENQGRNQGRNNFSTDQERAGRSAQGGSNRHAH
jgi:general stress protein YciG